MSNTLNILKERCKSRLDEAQKNNNQKQIKIYETIDEILNTDGAFLKLDAGMCLNIMHDLGYINYEAVKIYSQIVKNQ